MKISALGATALAVVLVSTPAFAQATARQTTEHRAGRPDVSNRPWSFSWPSDRAIRAQMQGPQENCPDFGVSERASLPEGTFGCWSAVSYSMPTLGSWLDIQLEPAYALVYVNGRYTGTAQQFTKPFRPLKIGLGPQRIELRAPGYTPMSFWINQRRDRVSTLGGSMTKIP